MLKDGKPVLFDTYLYYTQVTTPVLMYKRQAVAGKPFANKEYTVQALIEKADLKALKKRYPTAKSLKNARTYDSKEEFESAMQCDAPYDAEEYFTIKITKMASYQDGSDNRKRVKLLAGKGVKITGGIGNGSKGDVQWKERVSTSPDGDKSIVLDLFAVRITEYIPYGGDELEFDGEEVENEPHFSDPTSDEETPDTASGMPDDGDYDDAGTGDDVPF